MLFVHYKSHLRLADYTMYHIQNHFFVVIKLCDTTEYISDVANYSKAGILIY